MSASVQLFLCPRCKGAEFRSLPGADGKAFCPWCGDRVAASGAAPAPTAPAPAAAPPGPGQALEGVAAEAPEAIVRVLRDRVAELDRKREQAEVELRRELDKKQAIKQAVVAEVGRLESQLGETKTFLRRKDEDHQAALAEGNRLKEELARERKRADEQAGTRGSLEEKEKAVRALESELEQSRKSAREHQEARDAARREIELLRSDLAKGKESTKAGEAEHRTKLAAVEARARAAKDSVDELSVLKARYEDLRRRSEKERAELQEKASGLQSEVEKRDQRVRDLQLLVKTLGERLNDLTSRRL